MTVKEILGIDPVLLTGIGTTFVAVCGALGAKDLLRAAYERYCKKEDEKDSDHKELEKLSEQMEDIIARLDEMSQKDAEFMDNDMLLLEDRILFMQRKAIQVGKVSKACMPRYNVLHKRYLALNEKSQLEPNDEIEFNHKLVLKMFEDGKVMDNFWDSEKEA